MERAGRLMRYQAVDSRGIWYKRLEITRSTMRRERSKVKVPGQRGGGVLIWIHVDVGSYCSGSTELRSWHLQGCGSRCLALAAVHREVTGIFVSWRRVFCICSPNSPLPAHGQDVVDGGSKTNSYLRVQCMLHYCSTAHYHSITVATQ